MIMSLEIKVVSFEIDLVKISLKIYELLFKKDEEEIKKLVDEMVTLWKNFSDGVQVAQKNPLNPSEILSLNGTPADHLSNFSFS